MSQFRLSRAYTWATISQAIALVAAVVAQLILARALGAEERARLGFQISVTFLASQLLSCGLHWGLAVRVARRELNAADALGASFASSTLVGLIYVFGALAAAPLLTKSLHVAPAEAVLGGLVAAGTALISSVVGIANAQQKLTAYNRAVVVWRGSPLLLLVPFWLASLLDLRIALGIMALGTWTASAYLLFTQLRTGGTSARRVFATWLQTAPLGFKALSANAFVYAQQRADVILAAALLEPRQAGTYALLAAVAEMAVSPAQAMATVIFSAIAGKSRLAGSVGIVRSLSMALYLGIAIALGFAVLVPAALAHVVGPTYTGWSAAGALAPGVIAASLGVVLHGIHTARGYPTICTSAPASGLVVLVALTALLSTRLGSLGVGLAWSAAHAVRAALLAWAYAKATDVRVSDWIRPQLAWGAIRTRIIPSAET